MAARCVGAIAHLRGCVIDSDDVRSMVLLSLVGAAGAGVLAQVGVGAGNGTAVSALRQLPGHVLVTINQRVGFRLFARFGETGVVNLARAVPLVGGGVGAGVNVVAIRTIARYARRSFPAR